MLINCESFNEPADYSEFFRVARVSFACIILGIEDYFINGEFNLSASNDQSIYQFFRHDL